MASMFASDRLIVVANFTYQRIDPDDFIIPLVLANRPLFLIMSRSMTAAQVIALGEYLGPDFSRYSE